MGGPVRQKTKPQKPDHDPKASASATASHVIRVDPPDLIKKVLLGGEQRLRYSVDNLKTGSAVKWHHTASGAGGIRRVDHDGPTSEINELASDAGEREVDTTADIDGRRESAASTILSTPRSPTKVVGMWGEHKTRGRTPVAHTMQSNEDLVVHIELPEVDDSVSEVITRFSGGLTSKDARKLGSKKFELLLTPKATTTPTKRGDSQDASGSLVVTPRRVNVASIDPAPVVMRIEAASADQDAFGGRPGTTENAVNAAVRKWAEVYNKRIDGMNSLMEQIAVTDPVPPDPLWERLLKSAAMIALNAVTAGFGAGVVSSFAGNSFLNEARKELTKVIVEETSATLIEKAVDHARSKAEIENPDARRTAGGTLLNPEIYFKWTQREALRDAKLDHLTRFESTLTSLTNRLDREHPSSGYRAAVAAHDAIDSQYQLAADLQYENSLRAYCTFIAQARLGVGHKDRRRDPGTELGSQVDVKKILPRDKGLPAQNLDETPGVLRLELAELAPGHMIVVRSFIAGFKGDAVVDKLKRRVGDLRIPVVARFNERGRIVPRGFVISRNENGAVLAESTGSLMHEMFGGKSDHDAARIVFEQIAYQTITPERG